MHHSPWKDLAERLQRLLGLDHPPLAISFCKQAPPGVAAFAAPRPAPTGDGRTGRVPAGCVFWIEAQERTFHTAAEDHFNCSVGSVTHGLKKLEEVLDNQDICELLESQWVTAEEAAALPVVSTRYPHIVYGPLADSPIDPDVVLLRINAYQAMVLHDALPEIVFAGKPQCHIVALAREQNKMAISTGCMLSRVRTAMAPEEMTCTIPAPRLAEAVEKIQARSQANAQVASYASEDRLRFGQRP